MCTALTYHTKDHYFGRNLDLEISYGERVTVTPRHYRWQFQKAGEWKEHYAMIGVAAVVDGYPLYFDAVNEKGLGMAGLNFPGNAYYHTEKAGYDNIASFEVIPWILGQCADTKEAEEKIGRLNIVNTSFSAALPPSPLHWMLSDKKRSLTLESVREGMKRYDNPVGVLTNNPPFDFHLINLNNYMQLTSEEPVNLFAGELELFPYSNGMGAIGLPGDLSSASRFVKAAFTKMHAVSEPAEAESVGQFFHILGSVEQQNGCVHKGGGKYEITRYSSCCNMDRGIYYYTTYDNRQITGVDMYAENLEGEHPVSYRMITEQQIYMMNRADNPCNG